MRCIIEGCDRPRLARGWCRNHYNRWHRNGDPLVEMRLTGTLCEAEGCGRPRYQYRRWCSMHTMRKFRYGDFDSRSRTGRTHVDVHGYVIERNGRQHRRVLLEKIGPGEHPCHWCGRIVSWDKSYPKDRDGLTTDHLDFIRTNNDPANLVPSCAGCNARRALLKRYAS